MTADAVRCCACSGWPGRCAAGCCCPSWRARPPPAAAWPCWPTSGFLLARASEHPSILAISVAVVAVRALSIGRGVSRYLERLTSHDVAFRVLADIRVAIYRRLERLAPAGLAAFRSGDLLAALISDVDATQDLFIRGIGPPLAAALVGAGAVTVVPADPRAGRRACWLSGCWPPGPWSPALAVAASRRAARATAPARGELSAAVTDLLSGAAELHAFGAQDAALAAVVEPRTGSSRRWPGALPPRRAWAAG